MTGKLSELQLRLLTELVQHKDDHGVALSAADVGHRLRPRISGIAATSVLRALERRGLVHRLPPRDQWSTASWASAEAGRAALSAIQKDPG